MRYLRAILISALALAATNPAPAGVLESKLQAEGIRMLEKLKAKGYNNVGVLKFRVQKPPTGKEEFNAGPLNVVVTRAVENALIVQNQDPELRLGLLRDAPKVINDKKARLSYLKPDDCKQMFEMTYPMAWGKDTAQPDAFVTGLVKLSPDRTTTTVDIEVVDKQTLKPTRLYGFDVPTDRSILFDVCEGFAVGREQIRTAGPEEIDRAATGALDGDSPLDLTIRYDGVPQEIVETLIDGRKVRTVAEPQERHKVTFVIKNRWNVPIGVVLAVNGRNTVHGDDVTENSVFNAGMWVLQPGKEYTVAGYYGKDGQTLTPFVVLSDKKSALIEEQDPNPYLGLIQVAVFCPSERDDGSTDDSLRKRVSTAGLKDAEEAAKKVAANGPKITRAGLIAPGTATERAVVETTTLPNLRLCSNMVIRYYERNQGK
jgi:hypothetical protein